MMDSPQKLFDFLIKHFEVINEEIKNNWGEETKFIVLTFEGTRKEFWQPQLEEMGIDVVDISDLINIKNLDSEEKEFFVDLHPTGKLWKLVVPKLKEKYPDL